MKMSAVAEHSASVVEVALADATRLRGKWQNLAGLMKKAVLAAVDVALVVAAVQVAELTLLQLV